MGLGDFRGARKKKKRRKLSRIVNRHGAVTELGNPAGVRDHPPLRIPLGVILLDPVVSHQTHLSPG